MIKLSELLLEITAKYRKGQKIPGLGKISDVFIQKDKRRGEYVQYEIDGQFFDESVLDDAVASDSINKISFDEIHDLITRITLGKSNPTEIKFGWKLFRFLNTSKGREQYKKYDRKVISRFNWLQANLGSAVSKYPQYR